MFRCNIADAIAYQLMLLSMQRRTAIILAAVRGLL